MKRRRLVLLFGLFPFVLLVANVDCYGPTEAVVSLTSDPIECGQSRVAIYKGAPGAIETTAQAETNKCTTANNVTTIGDLVFVPSGDKEGRMSLRATMALGGKPTAACAADPANCIFATRTFGFIEHASRPIPIRFLHDCIGAVCPSGSTCTTGRVCVSDECADDQCNLSKTPVGDAGGPTTPPGTSPTVPGVTPPPDIDASLDADAAVDLECTANGTNILATAASIPGAIAASPGEIYWGEQFPDASAPVVQRTVKDSGATTGIFKGYSKGDTIQAIGFDEDFLSAGGDGTGTALIKTGGDGGSVYFSPAGTKNIGAIAGHPSRFVIATDDNKVYERPSIVDPFKAVHNQSSQSIVSRSDDYYAATSTAVVRILAGQSASTGTAVGGSPANALLAKLGDDVFAMGQDGASWAVWAITPALAKVTGGLTPATSFALDDANIYWTDTTNNLSRAARGASTPETLLHADGVTLAHVFVDDRCLYFWSQHAGERATLRSIPKKPLATLAAGPAQ